ncbi:MAG: SRPBCC family protein [Planctomycetota bacterium]
MTRVSVEGAIAAPPRIVFRAVSDVENLPAIDDAIVEIEFLTEQRSGEGTRFRETRSFKGRSMVTELDVTEWVADERVRMVADSHGTVWDTVFRIRPQGDGCILEIEMDARPHRLMPRLTNPLMKGFFRRGIAGHVDKVRAYSESVAASARA